MIATAPGKLLLTGEYAVLDGAPALVVAVNRRVIARRRKSVGSSPFLIAVADELARRYGDGHAVTRAAFEIVVDSSAFFLGQAKLGLGSSAAVTVAATALALAAERHVVPMIDRDNVIAIATAAHQQAQRSRRRARDSGSHMIVAPRVRATTEELAIATTSRDSSTSIVAGTPTSTSSLATALIGGSGADIAAAVHGGVIAFVAKGSTPPQITRLTWPTKLRLIPFFTGESADTAELIARVMDAKASQRAGVEAALTAIARASKAACQGAESRTPEIAANAVLEALKQAAVATEQLAEATGLALIPPCVTKAQRAMAKLGGIAKTTGAGGGDVGVAVLPATENLIIAERLLTEAGCQPLRAEVDSTGVDLQPDAQ